MQSFSIDSPPTAPKSPSSKPPPPGFTKLIFLLCLFNIILKASYTVWAPFLPTEASRKGVDQAVVGAIFWSYSVAFAIVSPMVGKLMAKYGRRNFLILGSLLNAIANFGFVALHYFEGANMFIVGFTVLRLIQGIGTGCLQTANYSILSLMYPTQVEFVCGCLEAAAGIGMCLGPIIGIPFYQIGGYIAPFLAFGIVFVIYWFLIKPSVPYSVEELKEAEIDTSKYSYGKMLKNKRILFANIALLVNIFQYTFIDPFLAIRMRDDFGLGEKSASILFFVLGVGYAGACQGVYITLKYLSFRRCFFIFFILNGLWTIMYSGISQFSHGAPLNEQVSLIVIATFMFFGGISSAHTIIPTLPEILEAGKTEIHYPAEVLNDLSSGLFNMSFAFGEILGPLIGNFLYVKYGMAETCNYIGFGVIAFSLLYFTTWDASMQWNAKRENLNKKSLLDDDKELKTLDPEINS
jgi:MFS family permease